jgi:hypothetical protein
VVAGAEPLRNDLPHDAIRACSVCA